MANKCKDIWGFKGGGAFSHIGCQKHHKVKNSKSHKNCDKDIWGFNPDLGTTKGKCETKFDFN